MRCSLVRRAVHRSGYAELLIHRRDSKSVLNLISCRNVGGMRNHGIGGVKWCWISCRVRGMPQRCQKNLPIRQKRGVTILSKVRVAGGWVLALALALDNLPRPSGTGFQGGQNEAPEGSRGDPSGAERVSDGEDGVPVRRIREQRPRTCCGGTGGCRR